MDRQLAGRLSVSNSFPDYKSMGRNKNVLKRNTLLLCSLIMIDMMTGFIIPSSVVYCLAVFVSGHGLADSFLDVLHKQFAAGENLFLLSTYSLIPFLALSVASLAAAYRLNALRLICINLSGLLGIIFYMIPCHVAVWYPHYHGMRVSSTSVITFVFAPFISMLTLGFGLLTGWLISLCLPRDL